MTAEEALNFIHSVRWQGSKPGLSRTRELLSKLGDPQDDLSFVHIAGTNGKGSTAAMLASILREAGYKTGLYTSPYIFNFNERMQISGVPINDEELATVTQSIVPHALKMEDRPTEFELVTALGFSWFAEKCCDIVVLEVGMGGRLDSTNVISSPQCAVITNIGLDHTRELGNTVEEIAAEKADIIKPGCDAVLYEQKSSVMDIVADFCQKRCAALHSADFTSLKSIYNSLGGQTFRYRGKEYFTPLLGAHQIKNAAVVLETVYALRGRGWDISDEAVAFGLEKTIWPARFELVCRDPWFVVDGGHNPQCAETVAANLNYYFPERQKIILLGVLADKDYACLTDILAPVADAFVAVSPDSPRALPASDLAIHLERYGKPVICCETIERGVKAACDLSGKDGVACAVGSLYMAGRIRACFGL